MPQMSPCSWMSLIFLSNIMLYLMKIIIFFEKKC